MSPSDIGAILARLDAHHEMLERIEVQATKTNGRVTALERSNIAREAAAEALARVDAQRKQSRAWVPSSATALVIFAAGVAAERFL